MIVVSNPLTERFRKGLIEGHVRNKRESVCWMLPFQFLRMANPLRKYKAVKHDRVKRMIQNGSSFQDLPYLRIKHIKDNKFKVMAHEGRHRNTYLSLVYGQHLMPVRFIPIGFKMEDVRGMEIELEAQMTDKTMNLVLR